MRERGQDDLLSIDPRPRATSLTQPFGTRISPSRKHHDHLWFSATRHQLPPRGGHSTSQVPIFYHPFTVRSTRPKHRRSKFLVVPRSADTARRPGPQRFLLEAMYADDVVGGHRRRESQPWTDPRRKRRRAYHRPWLIDRPLALGPVSSGLESIRSVDMVQFSHFWPRELTYTAFSGPSHTVGATARVARRGLPSARIHRPRIPPAPRPETPQI